MSLTHDQVQQPDRHSCDFDTFRYSNQTGVEVRPLDWGGLGGLEALDPGLPQLTPLYRALAEALKDEGFREREDLFGAPYDFRLAGDGLDQVWILGAACYALLACNLGS